MRLTCPLCGPRDRREFYYMGAATYLDRPGPEAAPEAWDDYLHLRDNPAGVTTDLWYHETGCTSWLRVTRNTLTHEILAVGLVAPLAAAEGPPAAPSPKTAAKAPARKKKTAT